MPGARKIFLGDAMLMVWMGVVESQAVGLGDRNWGIEERRNGSVISPPSCLESWVGTGLNGDPHALRLWRCFSELRGTH